jgi:hypothetical protein
VLWAVRKKGSLVNVELEYTISLKCIPQPFHSAVFLFALHHLLALDLVGPSTLAVTGIGQRVDVPVSGPAA